MESENGFLERRFDDFESDFFNFGPLFFLSDIVDIDMVLCE